MKVRVTVTEILQREVIVEAASIEAAEAKVESLYHDEEIVLDYGDLVDTNYTCCAADDCEEVDYTCSEENNG